MEYAREGGREAHESDELSDEEERAEACARELAQRRARVLGEEARRTSSQERDEGLMIEPVERARRRAPEELSKSALRSSVKSTPRSSKKNSSRG